MPPLDSSRIFLSAGIILLGQGLAGFPLQADEPATKNGETGVEKEADKGEDSALMKQARLFISQTKVEVLNEDGTPAAVAEALPEPVLTYGDLSRALDSSSIWAWKHEGEPIAMMKVEQYIPNGRSLWMFCFSNLSPFKVRMNWEYQKTPYILEPLQFQPVPGAPVPPESDDRGRQFQMRMLSREFIAFEKLRKGLEELRLLPRPLVENIDPATKLTRGAVFGEAVSTNPDGSLVLRIAPGKEGKLEWTYAPVRMSYGGLKLQHKGEDVWTDLQNEMTGHHVRWGYFHISRDQ